MPKPIVFACFVGLVLALLFVFTRPGWTAEKLRISYGAPPVTMVDPVDYQSPDLDSR